MFEFLSVLGPDEFLVAGGAIVALVFNEYVTGAAMFALGLLIMRLNGEI